MHASSEAFAAAILGKSKLAESVEFAATILREYSPDQPRDEKGRWTSDGSGDGAAQTTSTSGKREQKDLDTMVERLTKTSEGKKLYDTAKKAAKDAGSDELTIKLEKPENLPNSEAAMDPQSGTIGIPDDASDASMLEDILVELSNMAKSKEFAELQTKGIKQLTRDKYIETMERSEFDSMQSAARIWKAVAKDCGQDPSKMPTYKNPDDVLKRDFKTHFSQVANEHKEGYGHQWDDANSRHK
jgi:hypothetical protein